jgi:hypothetical protein
MTGAEAESDGQEHQSAGCRVIRDLKPPIVLASVDEAIFDPERGTAAPKLLPLTLWLL